MNPLQSALGQVLGTLHQAASQGDQKAHQIIGNIVQHFQPSQARGQITPQAASVAPDNRQFQLNALVQNTIDQTPYTPAAINHIKNLNYDYYGTEPVSSIRNNMTGGQYQGGNVMVNASTLDRGRHGGAVDVLRHELIHSMDQNVNREPPQSEDYQSPNNYSPLGANLLNSEGFFNLLAKLDRPRAQAILKYALNSGIYGKPNQVPSGTKDLESFAYAGSDPNVMLRGPQMAAQYNPTYIPMSKYINYSPMYPSPELYTRLVNEQMGQEGDPGS